MLVLPMLAVYQLVTRDRELATIMPLDHSVGNRRMPQCDTNQHLCDGIW